MRLVDSSDPTAVPRADAMRLINERLALANGVFAALDVAEGRYVDEVAGAGLSLLRRWVHARYPIEDGEVEPHAWDGLDGMTVPSGGEERMVELRLATAVCARLAWMCTADHDSDYVNDRNGVSEGPRQLARTASGRPHAVWSSRRRATDHASVPWRTALGESSGLRQEAER